MAQVNLFFPPGAFDGYDGDLYIVHVPTGLKLNDNDFYVVFGLNWENGHLQIMLGHVVVPNIDEFGIVTHDRRDQAFMDGVECMVSKMSFCRGFIGQMETEGTKVPCSMLWYT